MLTFGEKQDLLFVKKMEQFSKSIGSERNIKTYISKEQSLHELGKELTKQIEGIREHYKSQDFQDFNDRVKITKEEISTAISRFI